MKFNCRQELLMEALQICTKAISARSSMPILDGVLLEAYDQQLTLTCSDMNMSIVTNIEADVVEEGSVVLPGKLFSEIVRKMPISEINCSIAANNAATLRCNRSRATISGFAANEFPHLPEISVSNSISVPQSILRDIIRQTSFSAATDENRPIFTGCLMEIADGRLNMVALDGFRLALRNVEVESASDFSALIPGRSLNEISRILGDDGEAEIQLDNTHISFSLNGTRIIVRMLEGEFIKYRSIIPATSKTTLKVNRAELASCIDRASLLASEGKNNLMKFNIGDEKLIITSNSDHGESYEEVALMEQTGDPLVISFNIKYMSDIMKVIDDEEIIMRFNSAVSPCVIGPVASDSYTYLVLPVRSA